VVSRRHTGLALVWASITVLLNALIVPLSMSGLQAEPFWEILDNPTLRVAWSSGLGLLSTLCVCGCLWADLLHEGSGLPEAYETYLLGRISEEEAKRCALTAEVSALRAEIERAESTAAVAPAPAYPSCCLRPLRLLGPRPAKGRRPHYSVPAPGSALNAASLRVRVRRSGRSPPLVEVARGCPRDSRPALRLRLPVRTGPAASKFLQIVILTDDKSSLLPIFLLISRIVVMDLGAATS
jgi:hypothetical protein